MQLEIRILQDKLAEREKDVDREKDHVNYLRRELKASHEINSRALNSISTQNEELIKKSNEETCRIQSVKKSMDEQEEG